MKRVGENMKSYYYIFIDDNDGKAWQRGLNGCVFEHLSVCDFVIDEREKMVSIPIPSRSNKDGCIIRFLFPSTEMGSKQGYSFCTVLLLLFRRTEN